MYINIIKHLSVHNHFAIQPVYIYCLYMYTVHILFNLQCHINQEVNELHVYVRPSNSVFLHKRDKYEYTEI